MGADLYWDSVYKRGDYDPEIKYKEYQEKIYELELQITVLKAKLSYYEGSTFKMKCSICGKQLDHAGGIVKRDNTKGELSRKSFWRCMEHGYMLEDRVNHKGAKANNAMGQL